MRKRACLGKFDLDQVLPLIGVRTSKGDFRYKVEVDGKSHVVKLGSHRLLLFKENLNCVKCQRIGSYFLLEQDEGHARPHFNLYSKDDILMTKDHIIPKSKGGSNDMSNYQTMCAECNAEKADRVETEEVSDE